MSEKDGIHITLHGDLHLRWKAVTRPLATGAVLVGVFFAGGAVTGPVNLGSNPRPPAVAPADSECTSVAVPQLGTTEAVARTMMCQAKRAEEHTERVVSIDSK